MSRHPRSPAARGSEKWLQLAVNHRPDTLDRTLGSSVATPIQWVSPLADDEHAGCRDQGALDRLGVTPSIVPLTEFWPRRGQQWDARGLAADGTAVLVEAKAHVMELVSGPSQAGSTALPRIAAALDAAKKWYGAEGAESWNDAYYQYANRLAHLYFLRELNRIPATLVFLSGPARSGAARPTTPTGRTPKPCEQPVWHYLCGSGDIGWAGSGSSGWRVSHEAIAT